MSIEIPTEAKMKILLVDDDDDFRWATGNILSAVGYDVPQAVNGREALEFVEKDIPDLVLMDYRMPGQNGLAVAAQMKRIIPAVPIVIITAYGEIDSAVKAMKMGIYDYVTKPMDNNVLLFTIKRALEKQDLLQEVEQLRTILDERTTLYKLMGNSDPIKKLVRHVEKVAPTPFTVLIEGESSTGKEIIARAIHDLSREKDGPFVALDCGAIPETLVESELFGAMKGAFTGADSDKPGHFELAHGGTLFLDEVGNLSLSVQQKLLRALQERVVRRLGGIEPVPVNVRIIAATNQSIAEDVKLGKFRSDLYFRMNEFSLKMPSLKERTEDIPYLAKKFLDEAEIDLKKTCSGFSRETLFALGSYHWPGNVRELRNMIRQAALLCDEDAPIQGQHLVFTAQPLSPDQRNPDAFYATLDGEKSLKEIVNDRIEAVEKEIIGKVLKEAGGNKSQVARKLQVEYKTLLKKIRLYGL
jgi:DNA-binding NtrC family response regulator